VKLDSSTFKVQRSKLRVGGAAVALMLAATVLAQGTKTFKARLSTVPIDIAMQSSIAGRGSVTATLEGNTLNINGTFQDLKSPATAARLHRGYRGVRGPAFADLKASSGTSGTISGSITLTPAQVGELGKSLFYVQVYSEKAPDGNLWGWLLPAEGTRK
jgi:CHRD domain-containing protein